MNSKNKPTWKKVATHNIKYGYYTLAEFLSMVKSGVPADTNDEDILLEIDVDYSHSYYDEIIIDAEMLVSIKATNEKED
jgi:hypothetical protein